MLRRQSRRIYRLERGPHHGAWRWARILCARGPALRVYAKSDPALALMPDAWRVDGRTVTNGAHRLSVEATVRSSDSSCCAAGVALLHAETEVRCFESRNPQPGAITTQYRWS